MDTTTLLLLIPVGLVAGALTTVAGLGGGLLLTVVLSALWDPHFALCATAPGLLAGNLHRYWRFRSHLDRPLARAYVMGGVPGALVGASAAVALPAWALQGGFIVLAAAVMWRHVGHPLTVPPAALVPGGFLTGFLTSTSSGGGLVAGPLLLAAGLRGGPYVATAALGAFALHVTRLSVYGLGGLQTQKALLAGAVLAVAIPLGNVLGEHQRGRISTAIGERIEVGAALVAGTLACFGMV